MDCWDGKRTWQSLRKLCRGRGAIPASLGRIPSHDAPGLAVRFDSPRPVASHPNPLVMWVLDAAFPHRLATRTFLLFSFSPFLLFCFFPFSSFYLVLYWVIFMLRISSLFSPRVSIFFLFARVCIRIVRTTCSAAPRGTAQFRRCILCAYFKNPTRYSDKLCQNLKRGAVSWGQLFSVHFFVRNIRKIVPQRNENSVFF